MESNTSQVAPLSVIIITKNAERTLRQCLTALASWVAEIIIIDSGSSDQTLHIAREFSTHVFEMDWPGYGVQKQRALDKTTKPWVLSLDADEVVSPELAHEILSTLSHTSQAGFALRFQSYYCGQAMRYGDWRNEYHMRLFRKSQGRLTTRRVHCQIQVEGSCGRLENLVHHYSYPDFETVLNKVNLYSSLSAEQKVLDGKQGSLGQALGHGLWSFFRSYVLRLGFLDGARGFMLSFSNAECSYYRYIKLWYLKQSVSHQRPL